MYVFRARSVVSLSLSLSSLCLLSAVDLRNESIPNGFPRSENDFCTVLATTFPLSWPLGVSIAASVEQRELIIMFYREVNTPMCYYEQYIIGQANEAGSPKHFKPRTLAKWCTQTTSFPIFLKKCSPSPPAHASLRENGCYYGDAAVYEMGWQIASIRSAPGNKKNKMLIQASPHCPE